MTSPAVARDGAPAFAPADATAVPVTACRACGAPVGTTVVDLGLMPLANSYLRADELARPEPRFPLRAVVCDECRLVQLDHVVDAGAIFGTYAYFSSYSDSWLAHARQYVEHAVSRFGLGASSQVIEVASNDGYLLQYFVARGIPSLGIEPAANVAEAALRAGIPTRVMYFDAVSAGALAREGIAADLMVANNVLAHVPDLGAFVRGFALLLARGGVATFEVPHLLRLLEDRQFDTIYHEHFSYFSLLSAERVFERHGLRVFDVQELPTHGGSLRLYVQHAGGPHAVAPAVAAVKARERAAGLDDGSAYARFGDACERLRGELVDFARRAGAEGRRLAAYGAPAKGNTLLNYCGIGADIIAMTVDRSPHKQQLYLPGTHIPIREPAALREIRPDYLLVLPWNLADEIVQQMSWIREWGGRFVLPVPEVRVLP
jgi:hypothetical protein